MDSIDDWCRKMREKAAKAAEANRENNETPNHLMEPRESSEDVEMDTQ